MRPKVPKTNVIFVKSFLIVYGLFYLMYKQESKIGNFTLIKQSVFLIQTVFIFIIFI